MSQPPEERSSSGKPLREVFGFDLDDARWLERVEDARRPIQAGARRIGDYEILGVVGRGGQGVVYRARQPRTGRDIVLKRLSAGVFATPEMHARFAREVEAASALEHPNIVTVYGSEIIDGQPVLAMQWIDGLPFDLWAADAGKAGGGNTVPVRRSVRDILEVFALVCDAVQHAHQRGVIHRDLKPSNILVDGSDEPHVLDFGLAKLSDRSRVDPMLTHSGVFVGTPAYAAPEQASGRHRDVDARTDVYALGAVLYQALTGAMVFEESGELPDLLNEIQRREARPPSAVDAKLGREIDAIVLKALAKDKEQRYASVEGFGADVRRYLTGQAVLAHPPSTTYRVRKFVRQHRAMVVIGSALTLIVLGAATVSTILYVTAERERKRTADALEAQLAQVHESDKLRALSEREWCKTRGVEIFLNRLLGKAHRGAHQGVSVITLREVLDLVAADLVAGAEPEEPGIEASIRMTAGDAYTELGLASAARPHFERALSIRRTLFQEDDLDVAESMEKLGRACRTLGDLDEAERMLEGALDIRRPLLSKDHGYLARNTNSLGILKRHRRKYAEAEALLLESLDHYRRGLGPDADSVPVVLKNLGLVYLDMDRVDEAEDTIRRAYAQALSLHDPVHIDVASCQINLAAVLTRTGLLEEAEELTRTAIDTLVRLHGDRFPMLATAQERLAEVSRRTGRLEEAECLLLEALASHRAAGNPIDIVRCIGAHARVLKEMGCVGETLERFREAVDVASNSLAPTDELLAVQKVALGAALVERGCFEEAQRWLLEAQPILAATTDGAEPMLRAAGLDMGHLERCLAAARTADAGGPAR